MYLSWNDAIVRHFFNEEAASRNVFLYVTDETIGEIAADAGLDTGSFIASLVGGPNWVRTGGIAQVAFQTYARWRDRKLQYPPYVAYLALFVLAAGLEGTFAPHAYYPRLAKLLGLPLDSRFPSFDRMSRLWDDLEVWSQRDTGGRSGIFKAAIAGQHFHVGLPIAQTILTSQERASLPQFFARAAIEPNYPPPDAELLRLLKVHSSLFRPRTRTLISSGGDDRLQALLNAVVDELDEWNGETSAGDEQGQSIAIQYLPLRLCLQLRTIAKAASFSIRCSLTAPLPENGLALPTAFGTKLYCDEEVTGWSTQLHRGDGKAFDAAGIDWANDFRLTDETSRWRLGYRGRSVVIFADAAAEGLSDLVEVSRVPRDSPFLLAFERDVYTKLAKWFEDDCKGVEELSISAGMRQGWMLFRVQEVYDDGALRGSFPMLSLASQLRMRFRGGIKSAPGNSYFSFAPPQISIDGGGKFAEISSEGLTLRPDPETGLCSVPDALRNRPRLEFEARSDAQLARQTLYFTSEMPRSWPSDVAVDRFGHSAPTNEPAKAFVRGAIAYGADESAPDVQYYAPLALRDLVRKHRRFFVVGSVPGQIVDWPTEPWPTAWWARWAIPMNPTGMPQSLRADASPVSEGHTAITARRERLWRDVVWHRRKRLPPPRDVAERRAWKEFVNGGKPHDR